MGSTVPASGVYTKVPGTLAVAFNCAVPSGTPGAMSAGLFQVIVGVTLVMASWPGKNVIA
jgi:hypothetical protein